MKSKTTIDYMHLSFMNLQLQINKKILQVFKNCNYAHSELELLIELQEKIFKE